jgi:hypothetical protein
MGLCIGLFVRRQIYQGQKRSIASPNSFASSRVTTSLKNGGGVGFDFRFFMEIASLCE